MKQIVLILTLAAAALSLGASPSAEAKRGHDKYDKHDKHYRYDRDEYRHERNHERRRYISAREIVYVRGLPFHRYDRVPVYVSRNRYGHPIAYYIMDRYDNDRYDRYHDQRYVYRDDNYRYRDRDDGITIIYRNR